MTVRCLLVALTGFVLGKRDDVFKVTVNEFGEPAGLASSHADLIVLPFTRSDVLLQRHQSPEQKQWPVNANSTMTV